MPERETADAPEPSLLTSAPSLLVASQPMPARIAAGQEHSLSVRPDGTVWATGSNLYGQLGDGTNTDRASFVQVQGLTHVVAVAAGLSHSLALRADGTVWAWGSNISGQLGDDSG